MRRATECSLDGSDIGGARNVFNGIRRRSRWQGIARFHTRTIAGSVERGKGATRRDYNTGSF